MPSSRGSSQPRDQTYISCIAGRFFITEPPGKPTFTNYRGEQCVFRTMALNSLNLAELSSEDTRVSSGFVQKANFTSEKATAPHSSTLAWKIPWTEEPGGLQSMGSQESDTTEQLHFHFSLSCVGERNGNPLPCSCLENPRDGGA